MTTLDDSASIGSTVVSLLRFRAGGESSNMSKETNPDSLFCFSLLSIYFILYNSYFLPGETRENIL